MVFDELRNTIYAQAIKEAVNKHSVVLDLGAGLGLHGMMAARAGAKKVYLVEPASILDITRQLVSANHLSEQIECISGTIEAIQLPEKVDVIISVFTGNFLLTEDLLPSLFFARDKYLAPGGKLIPDRATMNIVPVSAPEYYAEHIDCWNSGQNSNNRKTHDSQDIVLEPVRKYAENTLLYENPDKRKAIFLSEPAELLEMDFMTATEASCRNRTEVDITEDGLCHGWLGWFRMRLGQNWLSTSPKEKQTHWRQAFLPLSSPIAVQQGKTLSFSLSRPEYGEWSWDIEYEGEKQRQSSFLSEPVTHTTLKKKSDQYKPGLSKYGLATQAALSLFDKDKTTVEIVDYILARNDSLFPTRLLAEQFVKSLIEKHSS